VLDDKAAGCAELRSNRQCIRVGNVDTNDRAALILMDYPNRWCLKPYAHAD
jgi:predicted pyridoxine 5'-phosphate oxidase superfamily flavin-nucleotide-binding protein